MDFNNISDNDQRTYIKARFELEDLERKEVLSDEDYADSYIIVTNSNDDEAIKQFSNTYVSRSFYEKEKSKLEAIINRINAQDERINLERLDYEKHERAKKEREYLRKIKAYYQNNNNEVMRNIDVDNLSDDSVIAMYRVIASGLNYDELERIINSDARSTNNYEATNNRIDLYNSYYNKVANEINEFRASLVLDDMTDSKLNDTIKDINRELKRLDDYAKSLIAELDELQKVYLIDSFAFSPADIKKQISELKDNFKTLKRDQIVKYNIKIDTINKRIFVLKNAPNVNRRNASTIENLVSLNRCNTTISKWDQTSYLNMLDYEALVETTKIIEKLEQEVIIKEEPEEEKEKIDFKPEFDYIRDQLISISMKLQGANAADKINLIKEDIALVQNNINELKFKLNSFKDQIDEKEYKKYMLELEKYENQVEELNAKTIKKDGNDYKLLFDEISNIGIELQNIENLIKALATKVDNKQLLVFLDKIDATDYKLRAYISTFYQKHKKGELDDIQYANLCLVFDELSSKVNIIRDRINGLYRGVNNPKKEVPKKDEPKKDNPPKVDSIPKEEPPKGKGPSKFIIDKIYELEKGLGNFEKRIYSIEKPIKNPEMKKWLDNFIASIEKEIAYLRKEIFNDKINDNREALNRLTGLEKRIADIKNLFYPKDAPKKDNPPKADSIPREEPPKGKGPSNNIDARIFELENGLGNFEKRIYSIEKPVKSPEIKKWLDNFIAQLEKEIAALRKEILNDKEHDNKERLTRLAKLEKRIADIKALFYPKEASKKDNSPKADSTPKGAAFNGNGPSNDIDVKIAGLEKGLGAFEKKIYSIEKPVKNPKIKKWLDNFITSIEKEIASVKKEILNDKEHDNKERLTRIANLEKRLASIKSMINEKVDANVKANAEAAPKPGSKPNNAEASKGKSGNGSPLKVKNVKDSTSFYQKHKKVILVAAGLAGLALIYKVIGPLVIPTIIKGNLITMNKLVLKNNAIGISATAKSINSSIISTLRSFNEVLAKAINAKKISHTVVTAAGTFTGSVWRLANGAEILVDSATSSLLQGIAMSSIGSTILATPAIAAVIKLVKENHKKCKKLKVEDTMDFEEKPEKKDESKVKVKIEENKKSIKELLNEWIFNSEYDFDSFCEKNNLNEAEIEELREKLISKGMLSENNSSKRR